MRKEKKACRYHESLTIKQAQNKNFGLEEHSKLISKIYEQEKKRRAEEIDKERKRIVQEIQKTRKTFPLPGYALCNLHRRRAEGINDMCLHVVSCYMLKQERNKRKWFKQESEGIIAQRPVYTPDHFMFLSAKFPESYQHTKEAGYTFKHNTKADIYQYGRAAHDMNCFSTKIKTVGESMGAYPKKEPINVRFWQPEPQDLRDTPKELWRQQHLPAVEKAKLARIRETVASPTVRVPSIGLVEVTNEGVYLVKDPSKEGEDLRKKKI